MTRPAQAIIDLAALRHNYRLAQQLAPHSDTLAVVKANAYGHGAVAAAKTLEPTAPAFAVASFEEAMELRESGIHKPIMLLEGPFSPEEVKTAAQLDFWLLLHSEEQVNWVLHRDKSSNQQLAVWLKVDSGMHRLGLSGESLVRAYQKLSQAADIRQPMVLATHFAEADVPASNFTSRQLEQFHLETGRFQCPCSLANSAGVLAHPQSHGNFNRPGIMLYGSSPFSSPHPNAAKLKPVMTLTTEVIAVHQVARGETVGYGRAWTARNDSTIATLAIGYGDGYPRLTPNGTPVLIEGQRAALAGRVSMDMITVDITGLDNIHIGSKAILWGNGLDVNHIAELCGTLGYELLTRMPLRAPRRYINQD